VILAREAFGGEAAEGGISVVAVGMIILLSALDCARLVIYASP